MFRWQNTMAKLNHRCFCYITAAMLVPLRKLDHWSLSLVRDVTSTFFANYHAGSEGEKWLLDSSRFGCDCSKNTMDRPVIKARCVAGNEGLAKRLAIEPSRISIGLTKALLEKLRLKNFETQKVSLISKHVPLKDVRANCFCASLLRKKFTRPSFIERAR